MPCLWVGSGGCVAQTVTMVRMSPVAVDADSVRARTGIVVALLAAAVPPAGLVTGDCTRGSDCEAPACA